MKTRIAITGLGAVSPLGNSVAETWNGLTHARSGIGPITRFDPSGLPCRIAGEVKGLTTPLGMPPKIWRRLDPFIHYALAAAAEALCQARLEDPDWDRTRTGVMLGSSRGGISTLESNWYSYQRRGFRGLSPHVSASSILNQAPSMISQRYGILGPCLAVSTACASGAHAIAEAVRVLRNGDAEIMITGGSEAPITPLMIGAFARARALSRRNHAPEQACRPFDMNRDGFVISEGAGILVLETWEHAASRRAVILGEILGFGVSSDAYHMTAPDPAGQGMARAMELAMRDAGLGPDEIDLINSHGTATALNDRIEAMALHRALGHRAKSLPVCALKSLTGHMLGASGAIEAIASVLISRTGLIPPILNLDEPDPACGLNLVRGDTRREQVSTILSSSFAFGGANAVLIIRGFSS